jgi:hypothetical protein
MVNLDKKQKETFTKCRACNRAGKINEYGFCRQCVMERAKKIVAAKLANESPDSGSRISQLPGSNYNNSSSLDKMTKSVDPLQLQRPIDNSTGSPFSSDNAVREGRDIRSPDPIGLKRMDHSVTNHGNKDKKAEPAPVDIAISNIQSSKVTPNHHNVPRAYDDYSETSEGLPAHCPYCSKSLISNEIDNSNHVVCSHCKRCGSNDQGYDGLCYGCSHCQGCHKRTRHLDDGLCTTNPYCEKLRAYRKDIIRIEAHQNGSSGSITISFSRPIVAKERVFEKSELKRPEKPLDFIRQKQSKLQSPFSVTTVVDSETEIFSNRVDFSIISKQGRYFTRTISGGRYDFMGGTESGYYLYLQAEENDERILPILMKVLRGMKFACHVSNYSISGYFGDRLPSHAGEREHVRELIEKVKQELGVKVPSPVRESDQKRAITESTVTKTHENTGLDANRQQEDRESTTESKSETASEKVFDAPVLTPSYASCDEVPKQVIESIHSDLVDIRRKEISEMIRKGYAYNEMQAVGKISYDGYIVDLARTYSLQVDLIRKIVSDWRSHYG